MASPPPVMRAPRVCGSHMCDPYVNAGPALFSVDLDNTVGARHGEPAAGYAAAAGLRVAHVRPLRERGSGAILG